jgi:LacI family transcriptional regulator
MAIVRSDVTLRDVAAKAGVSICAVSNVLNGYKKSRIRPETQERIWQAAKDMGYRPNAIARSLQRQRTNTIGFYTGYGYLDAHDSFLAEVIGGIQSACDVYRQDLLLHGLFRGRSTDEIYNNLADRRIDGLLLHAGNDDPLVDRLAGSSLPVVALADTVENLPSVTCDNLNGMLLLMEYIWAKGHRNILYLTADKSLLSVKSRAIAYQQFMEEHGQQVAIDEFPWPDIAGYLKQLMSSPNRPTAICCWNDNSAYALIRVCYEIGVSVPEDFAVVGFDGLLDHKLPAKQLVTARAPWQQITNEAVRLLLSQINGEEVPRLTQCPVTVIEGNTV